MSSASSLATSATDSQPTQTDEELQRRNRRSNFLDNTYDMVDDSTTDAVVSWGSTNDSLIVWNPEQFETDVLPKYFKHNRFRSFQRQLNSYGFKRVDRSRFEFVHKQGFHRAQRHRLTDISRKQHLKDICGIQQRPKLQRGSKSKQQQQCCTSQQKLGSTSQQQQGSTSEEQPEQEQTQSSSTLGSSGKVVGQELGLQGEVVKFEREENLLMLELQRVQQQYQIEQHQKQMQETNNLLMLELLRTQQQQTKQRLQQTQQANNLLMLELVRTKQQQQQLIEKHQQQIQRDNSVLILELMRAQKQQQQTEERQQQMLSFMAKAMRNTNFLAQLVNQNENHKRLAKDRERRCLPKEEIEGDSGAIGFDRQVLKCRVESARQKLMRFLSTTDMTSVLDTTGSNLFEALLLDLASSSLNQAEEGDVVNQNSGVALIDLQVCAPSSTSAVGEIPPELLAKLPIASQLALAENPTLLISI